MDNKYKWMVGLLDERRGKMKHVVGLFESKGYAEVVAEFLNEKYDRDMPITDEYVARTNIFEELEDEHADGNSIDNNQYYAVIDESKAITSVIGLYTKKNDAHAVANKVRGYYSPVRDRVDRHDISVSAAPIDIESKALYDWCMNEANATKCESDRAPYWHADVTYTSDRYSDNEEPCEVEVTLINPLNVVEYIRANDIQPICAISEVAHDTRYGVDWIKAWNITTAKRIAVEKVHEARQSDQKRYDNLIKHLVKYRDYCIEDTFSDLMIFIQEMKKFNESGYRLTDPESGNIIELIYNDPITINDIEIEQKSDYLYSGVYTVRVNKTPDYATMYEPGHNKLMASCKFINNEDEVDDE